MNVVTLPDIPLVGQSCVIRSWWPTALINCACASKHALLLTGVHRVAACPDCGQGFAIDRVIADPVAGQVGVVVAQVVARRTEGL